MENRSRGLVAKYNAKWLRRIRLKSDLRSFLYWVILNVPRVLSFSIENSDMKYEEFCLLRRSCILPDLYVEQFVVRHNIFVPCPTGFILFDIAKRDDWIPSLEKKGSSHRVYFIKYDSGSLNHSITFYTKLLLAFFFLERIRISHPGIYCELHPILTTWESQNVILKKRINSTTILKKYVEVCKWRSLSILKVFVWDTDENIRLKTCDLRELTSQNSETTSYRFEEFFFFQKHRIKEKTSTNLCFPTSFLSKIFNVSEITSCCTYRCEISFFSHVFAVEKHYDDQFWILVSEFFSGI